MRRKFISFFSYAVIACMSAFALTACGGDDNEPDAPDTPDTPTGEASLVGEWAFNLDGALDKMVLNADHTGYIDYYNASDGSFSLRAELSWTYSAGNIKLDYVKDGKVYYSLNGTIKRLDSEILILYLVDDDDEDDIQCYIRNSAVITPTRDMMVGTWLFDYVWDNSSKMFTYDEVTLNSDGTGKVIWDACGEPVENQIKYWKFVDGVLSINYVNGGEAITTNIKMVLSCENMNMCCANGSYYFTMLRK